jgi:hypothetical protein
MAKWEIRHGRWWMLQWSINGWLSLGIHVDFRKRSTYGPYVDLHLGWVIVSVGRNPVMTNSLEMKTSTCRGGVDALDGVPASHG